jgi:NADPH:quinone reductase-like Zn-dependent oxidoreductase
MTQTRKAFGLADENAQASFMELPVPEPAAGEVRIRVRASSVNGYDAFVASGMARQMMEHRYPVIVGKDFAGKIDAVGEGVDGFAVGDEVVGIQPPTEHVASEGGFAEMLVVPVGPYLLPKPANLDMEHGASVGLAALTASVCVDQVGLSQGSTVLIVGATGGVGTYAVQLAKARGATVIATALPEDDTWIGDLGANETVDYSRDVTTQVRERHADGIDALIVAVQVGDGLGGLTDRVRGGGATVSTVGGLDEEALAGRGISASNVYAQAFPDSFAEVLGLAADGSLTVPVTRTYGFDEAAEALGLVGDRRSRGKVAVRVG